MLYALTDHHFAAICGRDLVLLAAREGEYALMAGAAEHVLLSGATLQVQDTALAEALLEGGVINGSSTGRIVEVANVPERSALDDDVERRGELPWPSVIAAGLEMPLLYHAGAFFNLIAHARRVRGKGSDPDRCDARLLGICAAFDRLSPWAPMPGECLFRSFMLLRILARQGYAPRWVFGVRTWPFGAHCWLQAGTVVLTDFADTLRDYTSIMVI